MILIIVIMLAGILFGRLTARSKATARFSSAVTLTVCALVGVLGYSIGADPAIMSEIHVIGFRSVLLAVTGTAGAIAGAYLLTRLTRNGK